MVENEEVTACLLEFVLQKNGYRVIHSHKGDHAKRLMFVMDPPDAVLLDMALPDMSGVDLLAYLRTQRHWHSATVAMLTTDTDSLHPRQGARHERLDSQTPAPHAAGDSTEPAVDGFPQETATGGMRTLPLAIPQ